MGKYYEIDATKLQSEKSIPFDAYNKHGNIVARKGSLVSNLLKLKGKWKLFINEEDAFTYRKYLLMNGDLQDALQSTVYTTIKSDFSINHPTKEAFNAVYQNMLNSIEDILSKETTKEVVNYAKSVSDQIFDNIHGIQDITKFIDDLRSKDNYTFTHSINVCIYFTALIKEFLKLREIDSIEEYRIGTVDLTEDNIRSAALGALLHDIGKTDVPEYILNKPGKLTDEEMRIMRRHPELGFRRLINAGITDRFILDPVLQHHCRLDGSGYPETHCDKINPFVQMISICDTYDAIRSERVYQPSRDFHFAINELKKDYNMERFEKPCFKSFLNIFAMKVLINDS